MKLYGGLAVNKLQLLGSGNQGKVYKIDSQRCIKVFKNTEECKDELESLILAQRDKHFPKLYAYGENYIIREYIAGIELNKYLSKNKLTYDISSKILALYDAMAKVGYNRLDSALFHIFITEAQELKIIDTSKAIKLHVIYPDIIIRSLDKYGYKKQFLQFVKETRPDLYLKWMNSTNKIVER
jgi:predicted Ser/Thr protein kinase